MNSNDGSSRSAMGLWLAAFVVAIVLALVDTSVTWVPQPWGGAATDPVARRIAGFLGVWVIHALLLPAVYFIARRFPLRAPMSWRNLAIQLAATLCYPLLYLTLLATLHRLRFGPNVPVGPGLLSLIPEYYVLEMMVYCAMAGASMLAQSARRQRALEANALGLKATLAEARLDALRRQLSPHFLFNALNTVTMLIRQRRNEEAESVTVELGALLRHLLRESAVHEVPLEEEFDFLARYFAIEQSRFDDRLAVVFAMDANCRGALVPRCVLQPLAENAVRHGVGRKADGGRIDVRACRDGNDLRLEVIDDGAGVTVHESGPESGIGLRNTRERLAQLYGTLARLELSPMASGGTRAAVLLPYHTTPAIPAT